MTVGAGPLNKETLVTETRVCCPAITRTPTALEVLTHGALTHLYKHEPSNTSTNQTRRGQSQPGRQPWTMRPQQLRHWRWTRVRAPGAHLSLSGPRPLQGKAEGEFTCNSTTEPTFSQIYETVQPLCHHLPRAPVARPPAHLLGSLGSLPAAAWGHLLLCPRFRGGRSGTDWTPSCPDISA